MPNKNPLSLVCALLLMFTLAGCYNQKRVSSPDGLTVSDQQIDTIGFYSVHHYSLGYNFRVKADTMRLLVQLPEEEINNLMTDSIVVVHDDRLVVADIRYISNDSIDSVWVQVARDQMTIGWVRESKLLTKVEPDDPISQFIDLFSNSHLLIFLVVIAVIAAAYLMRRLMRMGAYIIHFNDIPSIYPTLLALLVASSATLYATIQLFMPETWRHFYFHPSLNPFAVPPILGIFLFSVWMILIVGLASLDEVRKCLRGSDAVLYVAGLAGVCAVLYIVFSISTLYYIGYALLVAYWIWALRVFFKNHHSRFVCGKCGAKMSEKGKCPKCGALNV